MSEQSAPAVELRGVVKTFGDVTAVAGVDLVIADGEFFSLLGPSGCGKTTLLRMIAGLEFPTEGSIRIHGAEMGLRPPDRRPVNTVFQSYALFPHMTVAENVAFGLRMRKVARDEIDDRVARAIGLVQLGGMESRRPSQLSGGQQQRVALARALVNEPEVLLLDEPLGALDLKLRQQMQFELKDLQERVGITFVYVTHDQEEALTMSDRIAVMDAGRFLQVDGPETLYERPANRFVAGFVGDTNFLDAVVVDDGRVRLGNGREVAVVTTSDPGTPVVLALRPEKVFLETTPEEGTERVPGVVRQSRYLGDHFFYEVSIEGVGSIHVWAQNEPTFERYVAGDEVIVTWRPSAVVALED
ncbi:MAG: ABC transporter ATP-binding protein [Acidimicrobiia bacterium]